MTSPKPLSLADQVAVMRDRTLAQVGTPHTVYRAPANLGVAEFVGVASGRRCRLSSMARHPPTWAGWADVLPGFDARRARLLVRPEQIEAVGASQPGVTARVVDVSYFGHDAARCTSRSWPRGDS